MQIAYNTFLLQLMSVLIAFYFPVVVVFISLLLKIAEELMPMKICLEI